MARSPSASPDTSAIRLSYRTSAPRLGRAFSYGSVRFQIRPSGVKLLLETQQKGSPIDGPSKGGYKGGTETVQGSTDLVTGGHGACSYLIPSLPRAKL